MTREGHWSAPSLGQQVEIADGILPRELDSIDEMKSPAAKQTWGTPSCRDHKDTGANTNHQRNADRKLLGAQVMVSEQHQWPTPSKACADGGQTCRGGKRSGELLLSGAAKAYATPRAEDSRCAGRRQSRETSDTLYAQTVTDTNATPGSLNPTWVEWLMGWPVGWTDASLVLRWECPIASTDCEALGTARCLRQWLQRSRTWLEKLG